jgi:hypothetical protein
MFKNPQLMKTKDIGATNADVKVGLYINHQVSTQVLS